MPYQPASRGGEIERTVDLEELFSRVQPEFQEDEAWQSKPSNRPEIALWRRWITDDMSLLRAEYAVDIPWADATAFCRPEVFAHPSRARFDRECEECCVERFVAPGDAICYYKQAPTPGFMRDWSLIGSPQVLAAAGAALHRRRARRQGADDPWSLRIRMVFRRDWPEPGVHSCAFVPLHHVTEVLLEDWGLFKAVVGIIKEHPKDPDKSIITEVRTLHRVPGWATSLAAQTYVRIWEWVKEFRESEEYQGLVEKALDYSKNDYVVVTLRKCSKQSQPLLPKFPGSELTADGDPATQWETADLEPFTLAQYLRQFLERLGDRFGDVELHEAMDGRPLVPYQTAVARSDWERIWPELQPAFQLMRSACRRLRGGKHAPELAVGSEPRLVDRDRASLCAAPQERKTTIPEITVQNTFVHFGSHPPHGMSGSPVAGQSYHLQASTLDDFLD